RGLAPEVAERDRLMGAGACPCGRALAEGRLQLQRGSAACAALIGRPMLERDCVEFVAVPAQYQDRVLGVYNLFLDRPLAAMGEDMPDLLISVGRHLGLAMEKARLEGEAHRVAVMEERATIGNELHDSLAQSLIGMRLQVKLLGEYLAREDVGRARYEAGRLRRAVEQANDDVRELLTNYRLKIGEGGLAHTLAELVARFQRDTGIAVFFQNECPVLDLAPAQETQLFYIVQEALINIRKHSGAHNVRILLNSQDDLYTVLIEDDGLGIAESGDAAPGEHAGLAIMRERTERLQGQIVIESEPGEGTRIVLMFNAPQR
ncbi:MAG: histidine kinase, partial [Burkholderiales bacterium]|nr:histidine kinase [Burkholderiales bacterium]